MTTSLSQALVILLSKILDCPERLNHHSEKIRELELKIEILENKVYKRKVRRT